MTKGFTPAARLDQVAFSAVRQVLARATELQKQGREIIHFEIGEPDFDTPQRIVDETAKALTADKLTHYSSNWGDLALRTKIAESLREKSGINADPADILITIGAAEALFDAIMAAVNPGDEVILFSPAFLSYRNIVNMAGGVAVEIPLRPEDGFQLPLEEVRARITDKTKMIVVNNPHNPSGIVFSKEAMTQLGRIAVEHNLLLLSDEIYNDILFDGVTCFSPASLDELKDNVITVNGFSKAFAMTGWRVGYITAPKAIMTAILKVHQYCTNCVPTFIQAGAAKAIREPECLADVEKMRAVFQSRRDLVADKLSEIEGVSFVRGQGAFYTLVNVSAFGLSDTEFASRFLEEEGVATVPASGFGEDFKGHIRISFATSEEMIVKGLDKLKAFCATLKQA